MVKNKENNSLGFNRDSKFFRILLIIVTVFLLFAGPTYIPYLLSNILNLDSVVSVIAGSTLFAAGAFLMFFLIQKKIIS